MGRAKLEIKKLEEKTRRQVTYSKRSNGLLKKAYELSVLCDIDIALIMFSQNGKLSLFSGEKRIEEVLARYMNLPLHERESIFQGEPINITSQAEAEYHEHMLLEALGRVNNRRRDLEGVRLGPPNNPTNLHVRLNNANNAEAGENFAEVDNATSRRPETYTAATPAIHPPETSSPNKMKGQELERIRFTGNNPINLQGVWGSREPFACGTGNLKCQDPTQDRINYWLNAN
ncbi:truncated transcription factor CAULIFLOWER D-like [Amborella trichopoda]|uniref:truncated transcription factor CAULIFLOWER D-like n=1 Tax=Amborella trichopoda TaxID=13333 RepID=UPI0005D440E3|nr:truncated transcription factor CAULIFLOWER D-like [Amborella trichopoda]|eukprot:XP_011627580.1 truncated transcription factor CAULIFLOWER D-like [Amborella trichopoda]